MKYLIILAIIISVPVLQTSAYAENPREAVTIHTARTIPISNPTTGEPELYLSGSVVNGTAQGTYSGVQAFSRASGALQGIVSADHTGESWSLVGNNVLRVEFLNEKSYLFVEGQRTNKVLDNYNSTANWSTYAATLTVDSGQSPPYSSDCLKLTTIDTGNNAVVFAGTYTQTAPTQFARSVYAKGTSGNKIHTNIYDGFTNPSDGMITRTLAAEWKRFNNFSITTNSNAIYVYYMMTDPDNKIQTWYFQLSQIEQAEFSSSPIPTSDVMTTRAADVLSFQTSNNISAYSGRISFCAFTEYDSGDLTSASGDTYFLKAGDNFSIYFDESENKITFGAGGQNASVPASFSGYTDFCVEAGWQSGSPLRIRLNNGAWQYSSGNYSTAPLGASMYIGSATSSTGHLFGGIRNLKIEE